MYKRKRVDAKGDKGKNRFFPVSILILTLMSVSGCAHPATVDQTPPISSPPLELNASSVEGLSNESCKAPKTSPHSVAFGFPRDENLIPSSGNLKGVMIFVEFTDVRGDDSPEEVGRKFTEKFEEFYQTNSYGQLQVKVDIMPNYYLIDRTSTSFGMDTWSQGNPEEYFAAGIISADKDIDYSQYDFVIVMPPSDIKAIIYGPAFPGTPEFASLKNVPSERQVYRGAVGGADQRNEFDFTGWIWLSHEFGHVLGMEHQYNSHGLPNPIWDLMDNVYTDAAPSLFAWHRFQLGWFSESQLACYKLEEALNQIIQLPLSPLDSQDQRLKSAMVRLSEHKVLVVEVRSESPIDKLRYGHEGVLAYIVDTTLSGEAFPIKLVVSDDSDLAGQPVGTLEVGDSVTAEGFEISYLGQDDEGHWISIRSSN